MIAVQSLTFSRLLDEYAEVLELDPEDDVVILGNLETELESTEQDLIKRVEDILGKTEEPKKAKKKCKKFKDRLVRETFLKKESQVLQHQRKGLQPQEISDFKIELLKKGQGKIIPMSESRSSEVGVLDMQETALDAVLGEEKRGREEKRHRNEENKEVSSRPSNTSSRQLQEQSESRSRR